MSESPGSWTDITQTLCILLEAVPKIGVKIWARFLTQLNIVSFEVANTGSTEDGEVFELSASDCGAVAGNQEELGLSLSDGSEGVFVA